jgi:hypothetical protein
MDNQSVYLYCITIPGTQYRYYTLHSELELTSELGKSEFLHLEPLVAFGVSIAALFFKLIIYYIAALFFKLIKEKKDDEHRELPSFYSNFVVVFR